MKNYLILSLIVFLISCKGKNSLNSNDKNNVEKTSFIHEENKKIEIRVKKIIPEIILDSKKAIPQIISIDSKFIEYFDLNQNKVFKVDQETLKKQVSFIPKGGGYLYFYKKQNNYLAASNGWENNVTTFIKVNDNDLSFPNSMILDTSEKKIIIKGVAEGIDVNNKYLVYDLKTKKYEELKIKIDEGKFINKNRLLILKRFHEQQKGDLVIYNLENDSYKSILSNFSANNFISYSKKNKTLYYVTKGLVHSLSLETKKIKTVYNKSIYLPYIMNDSLLIGYVNKKTTKNLTFIKL